MMRRLISFQFDEIVIWKGKWIALFNFILFYFIICIIDKEYNEYCAPHQTPGY